MCCSMLGHNIADVLLPLRDIQASVGAMEVLGVPEGDIAAAVAKTKKLSRLQAESILLAAEELLRLANVSGEKDLLEMIKD